VRTAVWVDSKIGRREIDRARFSSRSKRRPKRGAGIARHEPGPRFGVPFSGRSVALVVGGHGRARGAWIPLDEHPRPSLDESTVSPQESLAAQAEADQAELPSWGRHMPLTLRQMSLRHPAPRS